MAKVPFFDTPTSVPIGHAHQNCLGLCGFRGSITPAIEFHRSSTIFSNPAEV
jgi:hypothetical protein